jgi:hypothetical protein
MSLEKKDIIEQTKAAFDLIQKLYIEISYLIKEIEGILSEQEENFVIGRPSGYHVSTRSSTGLETNYVNLWLMRKLSVCFIPDSLTKKEKGQTFTDIIPQLKVIYVRFVLEGNDIDEPEIQFGILHNISKKPNAKWIKKFEHIMSHMEWNNDKIFKKPSAIDFEDGYIHIEGQLHKTHLFDIKDSEAIKQKIINPCLKLYRNN